MSEVYRAHRSLLNTITSFVHFRSLLGLFGAVIVVIAWIALWSHMQEVGLAQKADVYNQVESVASAIAQNVARDIDQIDILVKVMLAIKRQAGATDATFNSMQDEFSVKDHFLHVSMVDEHGDVGDNTAFNTPAKRVNIRDREHFAVHARGINPNALFISKPVIGRGTGRATLQFSRVSYNRHGKFDGVIVAGLSPDALLTGLTGLNLGEDGGIAIMGADDIIRAGIGSYQGFLGRGFQEGVTNIPMQGKLGQVSITETASFGADRVTAIKPIAGYPLSVVVARKLPLQFGGNSPRVLIFGAGAIVLTGLIVFLVYLANRGMKMENLRVALHDQMAANAMQRSFIAMASHEFRTPMAIIDSSAQKLGFRAHGIQPVDIIERARLIRHSIKRMAELMERILSAAKLEEGLLVEPSEFSLQDMLANAIARAKEIEPERSFELAIGELPRTITGDFTLLDQAVSNVLSNAMKYSPRDTAIELTARMHGQSVVLEVCDHGIGIDAVDLDKLFTRFYRAKTSEGIAGTGIGLYFVKLIVEKHGGTASVRSARGAGTTITIRLPVKAPSVLVRSSPTNHITRRRHEGAEAA